MSGESLAFDIFAIDRASEVFKKVGEHAEDMGERFGKLGKIAAAGIASAVTIAIGAVGAVVKIGLTEYKENQNAVAQLNAVIKSTGGVAGVTTSQMEKLADTIQNYSGQTHESVEASEALLLGFGNIRNSAGANNDILTRATEITADMAARMGTTASAAAIQLGKALSNPTTGLTSLTRVGITFTNAQKAQIKAMEASGNAAGAQNLILAALQTRFGGAAAAAGQTLTGAMSRAKLAFQDVAASIVQKLIPVITEIVNWVTNKLIPLMGQIYDTEGPKLKAAFSSIGDTISTDVMPVLQTLGGYIINDVVPVFQSLGKFIMQHETLFKALAVAVGTMIAVWETYKAVMMIVELASKAFAAVQALVNAVLDANPIGIVVLALAGLAAGFIYAYKHSETFRDIVQGALKDVSGAFKAVMDVVKTVFDFLVAHWQIVLAVVMGPFGVAIDILVDHWHTFRDAVVDVWNTIEPILKDMLKAVETLVKPLGDVASAASKVGGAAGGILSKGAKLLGFDQGGMVPGAVGKAMAAVVHGGEMVLPADALTNTISPPGLPRGGGGASGAGGDTYITMMLDGNVFGTAVVKASQRNQRRTGQSISIPVGVTG